jgi:CRISPR/Cas system-associated endonuclease Cas3-HD
MTPRNMYQFPFVFLLWQDIQKLTEVVKYTFEWHISVHDTGKIFV